MSSITNKHRSLCVAMSAALACLCSTPLSAGSSDGVLELADLNGLNGFVLNGVAALDRSGFSVSAAGDINGDGIDDLIIGASGADPNGSNSGASYVVFGDAGGLPNPINLSTLNGLNGFVLNGVAASDFSGSSVSAAGDINGDGIDDLIIGARYADPNGSSSGASYVVFGDAAGLPHPFNLSSLNGLNGFVLNGVATSDFSGISVSAAGDINGDGIDDLIIGAFAASPNGTNSGASYVVFGEAALDIAISKSNGSGFVDPLMPVSYSITVSNLSVVKIVGINVVDALPASLINASWSCTPMAGATCTSNGSGNINDSITLPALSSVTYTLTADVNASEGDTISNTATATLPAGLVDVDTSNNSATDNDPVGLFADGFESD